MVLGTMVDSNVLSYPMPVIMKEQGTVVGRDRACPRTGSASPNDYTLLLHNDGHRVRQDTRVNCSTKDHALHACRKVPSRYDGMGALSPSRHDRARTVL